MSKRQQASDVSSRLSTIETTANPTLTPSSYPVTINNTRHKEIKHNKAFMMTLGTKRRLQKAFMKINFLPKNILHVDSHDCVDSASGLPLQNGSFNSVTSLQQSQSNPDLVSICYEDLRTVDYPEHVLKVYKADQTFKYLLIHKETTAHEVVMLALQVICCKRSLQTGPG